MEKRSALGKGLSALIPEYVDDGTGAPEEKNIANIKTALIKYNSFQPRLHYGPEALEELKVSIKEKGILQPILVRPNGDGYEVIAGERRLRAAQALGMSEVPAVIKDVSNEEALVLALIENIQREELNAIEEAKAFKRLIDEFALTQEQVADSVGKDRSTVANILRLLKLPDKIQEAVGKDLISMGHARALLSIADEKQQYQAFLEILEKGISVRQAEELTRKAMPDEKKKKLLDKEKDHEIRALEEELRAIFGTKVSVETKKKRGKLVIEYYSLDDLDRILEILRK
ncbi:MAG: ParB/RepB/Spo0J family partition protein [Candidatus Omnitrophota bacterium]